MNENQKQEVLNFDVESSLLQELGERLVARPEIALTELVKNSFDADATKCVVNWSQNDIIVKDNGHGMTFDEFKRFWMTISTSHKQHHQKSRKYKRLVSGSKGLGRFSARFLGKKLTVETVAEYKEKESLVYKKVKVSFDWNELDKTNSLKEIAIPYEITERKKETNTLFSKQDIGTTITINELRYSTDDLKDKDIHTTILELTTPYQELLPKTLEDKQLFLAKEELSSDSEIDDGFNVVLMGELVEKDQETLDEDVDEDSSKKTLSISSDVLNNYVWKTVIRLVGNELHIILKQLKYISEKEAWLPIEILNKKFNYPNNIETNVYADIRFFPRRKGTFAGLNVDGRKAWTWQKEHHGVKVFNHGFRISPFGENNDDWLKLDADRAHSERKWQSTLMKEHYPQTKEEEVRTDLNQMLYIPNNNQLIGAVFVNTSNSTNNVNALQPSTDRMGFLDNKGYKELNEIIRFSMEIIALYDKKRDLSIKEEELEQIRIQTVLELEEVIKTVKNSPTLSLEDKKAMLTVYEHLSNNLEDIDEYNRQARENLQSMSLLGIVAAFMTHEHQSTLFELGQAIQAIEQIQPKTPEMINSLEKMRKSLAYFQDYMDYTTLFVRSMNQLKSQRKPFVVKDRIDYVLNTFKRFREERNIHVSFDDISDNLMAPNIPVAMYDGFVHNLYSNALKALIDFNTDQKIIKFTAWNEPKKHCLQVMDNGPGIPENLINKIWDPLFTTTSSSNNPLGSGMGIGLPMVKKTIEAIGGKIFIVPPPKGFSTCFKIEIPIEDN